MPTPNDVYAREVVMARVGHLIRRKQQEVERIARILRACFDPDQVQAPGRGQIRRIILIGPYARKNWYEDDDEDIIVGFILARCHFGARQYPMRTDVDHLPPVKQRELERIVEILFDEFGQATENATGRRKGARILKIIPTGQLIGTDMRTGWDDTAVLPDLIRDKQLLTAIVAEVAGADVAEANADATAKVQRGILVDCLTGNNGRAKVEGWLPKWFAFPPSGYTDRGGIGCVERGERIASLLAPVEIDAEPEMRQAA